MIKLYLGQVGSGKTACCVRDLYLNKSKKNTYSNIITKNIKNNKQICQEMLIKKEVKNIKKNGTVEHELKFNLDFWKDTIKKEGSINVILDEAHTLFNSRRAMSNVNKIMNDFMSMLRRVLGSSASGYGELTLITQLDRRIDVVVREMATSIRFHKAHYLKTCNKCKFNWRETNETPEPHYNCPKCKSIKVVNHSFVIEVWHFKNINLYEKWNEYKEKTYHKHYLIKDIETYFPFYDTLQWDDLITKF